jgi:RNA polymerase sigma-70 factor (sigma-E family)
VLAARHNLIAGPVHLLSVTPDEEFADFAQTASPQLRRTAFLLCGNWHTAEDLVQTTLAKVFVSWRKIRRRDAVRAYAARTLVNTYLADKRSKRNSEFLTDRFPERAVEPTAPETRMVVQGVLATLPPRARAVVVLRYWEDLSVDQVAAMLGCSPGNVKSLAAGALGKLRAVLDEALTGYDPAEHQMEQRDEAGDTRHG